MTMQCGAKTRDGDPSNNPPMRGSCRCRMHAAAAPAARRAAARRLVEAKIRAATAPAMAERQRQLDELEAAGEPVYLGAGADAQVLP
jgi:hypothetical protein